MEKITYVLGHKNPDTDSVVSSYAFALLQNKLGKSEYVAGRVGKLSPQTEFVFKKFNVKPPVFVSDLTPEVSFYMDDNPVTIDENQTLQFASTVMQKNDFHYLLVTDEEKKFKSILHYSSFARNLINSLNTEHHIKVTTNHKLLQKTLGAIATGNTDCLTEKNTECVEGTVILGASDIASFNKTVTSRSEQKLIVITGDREDIIRSAVDNHVYCIIVSGGRTVSPELIGYARQKGVCIFISPFDTASTSMLTSYAVPVSKVADINVDVLHIHDSVTKARSIFRKKPGFIIPVIDDNGFVKGVLSENNLSQESKISVSLVDHNEFSQAVDGIENYTVREIIDHHRIGAAPTNYPVTFINAVVGSTATIIASLFEKAGIEPDKTTAGLLLAGILSDTLILKSATVTNADIDIASKLASMAGVDVEEFGSELISAGSRIKDRSARDLIVQDLKEYSEGSLNFTVSQIEVDTFQNVLKRKYEFLSELDFIRTQRKTAFTALLVTDISSLDSVLLLSAENAVKGIMDFPMLEDDVYLLKQVVSRKKQLIPLLTELIQNL